MQRTRGKLSKRERAKILKRKRECRRRTITYIMAPICLVIFGILAYGFILFNRLNIYELDINNLEISNEHAGYTNIALFGVDSREGHLLAGALTDTIMIASLNNQTNEVRISSVYRDTLLKMNDGSFNKINAAYAFGGPEQAIATLNRNLDMDIRHFITLNFDALIDLVDLAGGVEIDVQEEEINDINGHAVDIINTTERDTWGVEHAGMQTLNGVQAMAYVRIRSTAGGDFRRAERQRVVLEQVIHKAQSSGLPTLHNMVNTLFPQVATNFTFSELLRHAMNMRRYEVGETTGFPLHTNPKRLEYVGLAEVAVTLEGNVRRLHEFLFDNSYYEPSERVKQISNDIIFLTGIQ